MINEHQTSRRVDMAQPKSSLVGSRLH